MSKLSRGQLSYLQFVVNTEVLFNSNSKEITDSMEKFRRVVFKACEEAMKTLARLEMKM